MGKTPFSKLKRVLSYIQLALVDNRCAETHDYSRSVICENGREFWRTTVSPVNVIHFMNILIMYIFT